MVHVSTCTDVHILRELWTNNCFSQSWRWARDLTAWISSWRALSNRLVTLNLIKSQLRFLILISRDWIFAFKSHMHKVLCFGLMWYEFSQFANSELTCAMRLGGIYWCCQLVAGSPCVLIVASIFCSFVVFGSGKVGGVNDTNLVVTVSSRGFSLCV
jgi:hypothetical protein